MTPMPITTLSKESQEICDFKAKEKELEAKLADVRAQIARAKINVEQCDAEVEALLAEYKTFTETYEAAKKEREKENAAYLFATGQSTDISWTEDPPKGYEIVAQMVRAAMPNVHPSPPA